MQIDHTRIVIRERGLLDILDLALCVVRAYWWPLVLSLAAGVVPMLLLNWWLLHGWARDELAVAVATDSPNEPPFAYLWWMLLLVMWETPVATSLATLYLGEAVFREQPPMRGVLHGFWHALPQLVLYQVMLRGLLIVPVITWIFPFTSWPYLNEVILLERNPLRKRRPDQITTFRRSRALHRSSRGDLFARWLAVTGFGALLFFSLWLSMRQTAVALLDDEWFSEAAYTIYYPLALWITAGYFTVARLLGYLDMRIRREGWELELLMRAEGSRLSRQLV
jgi:hypothetical protein